MVSKSYSINYLGNESNISFKVIIACFDTEDLNDSTYFIIYITDNKSINSYLLINLMKCF